MKKSMHRYGTHKALNDSYYKEYCIRQKYLNLAVDPFVEFLHLTAKVYHPPSGLSPAASAERQSELVLPSPAPADSLTADGPGEWFTFSGGRGPLQPGA